MDPLPYPPLPTEQQIVTETKIVQYLLFFAPPLMLAAFVVVALLVALCISYNFNPMQWLE